MGRFDAFKQQAAADDDSTRTQVVIAPFTFSGHIIPAIRLADALASAKNNLQITFVLPQHLTPSDDRAIASVPNAQLLRSLQQDHSNVRLVGLPEESNGVITSIQHAFTHPESMQRPLDMLIKEMLAQPASAKARVCIISDVLMSWTQDIANKYGIPRYVIYPGLAVSMAWVLYLPILQAQRRLPLRSAKESGACDTEEDFIIIPGLRPFHRREWNTLLLDTFPASAQDVYVKNCLRTHEASGILIDTFEELEPAAISALENATVNPNRLPIYVVGPLIQATQSDQSRSPGDAACLQWLDNQAPSSVVYVCFGSVYDPTWTQVHELALGLQASDQRFLWVLRPGPGTTEPDLSAFLPQGFLSNTHEQGLVLFDWAPQNLILSHPSIGAFFTHCGYNSVLETISKGVPIIGFPQFADHHLNCKLLVEDLGVGVEARAGESDGVVKRGEVERSVRAAMVGSEAMAMRKKAKEWRDVALKAVSRIKADGSSKRSLKSFIHNMLDQLASSF